MTTTRLRVPLLFQRLSHLTLREWILRPYCTVLVMLLQSLPAGRWLWRPMDVRVTCYQTFAFGSSAVLDLTMGVPLFFVPVRNTDHNCSH
jgi:hypothetical protein